MQFLPKVPKKLIDELLTRSFLRYIFIGGTTFALDFGLLVLLHGLAQINVLVAASVSYWTSIIFNFTMNRFWTFGVRSRVNIHKHVAMYGLLLAVNYLFTVGFIAVATHFGMHYTIAKIISVAIQTSWTYFIYKKIIFRQS